MDLILKKAVPVICIALAAPLVLSSCSRTVSSSDTAAPASSVVQEQAPSAESEDWQKAPLLLMKAGKPILKKAFGKITMSPRNTMKIWGMASIRSTSKLMEKPCPMFA